MPHDALRLNYVFNASDRDSLVLSVKSCQMIFILFLEKNINQTS